MLNDLHGVSDDSSVPVPPDTLSFGGLLRQQRLAAGLTQAALAERAGIAERTVQDLERGAARPRRATVRRLIDALKPSPEIRAQLEATIPTPRQRIGPPIQMLTPYVAQDDRQSNLPIPPTTLLGRERELSEILALVRDGARLVTLTGPGGVGKTRLGIAVAAELLEDFTDGVFLVELAPISDAALVPSTIAQVLGVRDVGGRPIADAVKNHLRARSVLLLLDNFEQILPAAPVVADLLATCPHLKVLATSREPLRVRGEQEYGVPPLTLADARQAPTTEVVLHAPAVALFVQRARAIRADFGLTDENAAAIAEICARLDGLPLALELAAARIRLLSPEALLRRLGRRLPLLTGGARDLPARQRTLRDTVSWSYDLLAEAEQRLFRRLSILVSGFTLEAAEAVCGDGEPGIDVLDGIGSLVEHSLVRSIGPPSGEPRFGILETIREYGLEQLETSGEATEVRRRHADFYLALAEQAEPKIRSGPEQREWLARVEAEHDNLREALERSLATASGAEAALRLAGTLRWFWWIRGHLTEGRHWLDRALATSNGAPASLRANALHGAGVLAWSQGAFDRAETHLAESLALRRSLQDRAGIASSLAGLAHIARDLRDYDRAVSLFEECLGLYRELGDPAGIADAVGDLGHIASLRGDYERAAPFYVESLDTFRKLGEKAGIAWSLHNLGELAYSRGAFEQAMVLLRQSLVLKSELGDKAGMADSLERLAMAAVRVQPPVAGRLFGAAVRVREDIGAPPSPANEADRDAALAPLRASLGAEGFAAAWDEGRAMTLEQAIAYALEGSGTA